MALTTEQVLTYILPLGAAAATWLVKGRIESALGYKRELKTQETITLENLQKKLEIYQNMLNDVPQQYKKQMADLEVSLVATINRLHSDLEIMGKLNDDFAEVLKEKQEIIEKQDQIIASHRQTIAEFEAKHGPLK